MEYPYLRVNNEYGYLLDDVDLTYAVAKEIRSFPGHLSISDINVLPMEFISTLLEEFKGPSLSLGGNFELTSEAAEILSKYKGNLNLVDLEQLSLDAAQHLANHQGGPLYLGLTNPSDEVIFALAKHQGELGLNSVTELSEPACLALSKQPICVEMESLELESLTPVSIEAFKKAWPDVWGDV